MHRLQAHTVPFYNDGPDAPWTPILAEPNGRIGMRTRSGPGKRCVGRNRMMS